MEKEKKTNLKSHPIRTSAPCRIDLGGTLDIATFYYPLMYLSPCTFNIAMDIRTYVTLKAFKEERVKISSKGFNSVEYESGKASFNHPLGLMCAIAEHFRAHGVHIEIDSTSPTRSALGGSSSAAVALIGALSLLSESGLSKMPTRKSISVLGHGIEASLAQVSCGMQDQLAAAYGGVNAWYWQPGTDGVFFKRKTVVRKKDYRWLNKSILIAYCGMPHESVNINGKWVRQFLEGGFRDEWETIIDCTHRFISALAQKDLSTACKWMNRETAIRWKMTPDVLEPIGEKLVQAAINHGCGARFTGAGGGGCLWALGAENDINKLKADWEKITSERENAGLLASPIDGKGLIIH